MLQFDHTYLAQLQWDISNHCSLSYHSIDTGVKPVTISVCNFRHSGSSGNRS